MNHVSIKYTLRYDECDLADKWAEQKPIVELYYDRNFIRNVDTGGIQFIALDEDDLDKSYSGTLTAFVPIRQSEVHASARLCLASFALHRNNADNPCFVDTGTANVMLKDVLEIVQKMDRPFEKELSLTMHTTHPYAPGPAGTELVKGKVNLVIHSIDLDGIPISARPPLIGARQTDDKSVHETIVSYVEECIRIELAMKDTVPGTHNIRAPMDISESGIELIKDMFLPIAAFAMVETPRSNISYWQNVFERVMRRRDMIPSDYSVFDKLEKARTTTLMMCFQAQSYDYISDEVDRNNRHARYNARLKTGFENFGSSIASGDCEDLASKIRLALASFLGIQISESTHPHLYEMQQIARQYVPLLVLAAVHGAKVSDDENSPKGAHMYLCFMPLHQFKKALSKTPEGREVIQNQPWPNVTPDPELETLLGEGTGMIDTFGHDDPMIKQRYTVMRMKTLAPYKKELVRLPHSASQFYLADLLYITDFFFSRGGTIGGFIPATHNPRTNEITRGTLWTDVINQAEIMRLVPQPAMSDYLLDICREAVSVRVPPRDLIFEPQLSKSHKHESFEPLDRIVDAVRGMKRESPMTPARSIDVFIRPSQINNSRADAIIAEIGQTRAIYEVDYELENITTHLWQYRVRFYLNAL